MFEATPKGKRKIVIATNSAETSLTIDGIRVVIDSGMVKEPSFDPERNMTTLDVKLVSKSSAEQRAGRAGTVLMLLLKIYGQKVTFIDKFVSLLLHYMRLLNFIGSFYWAAHIVHSFQQYCSALFHAIHTQKHIFGLSCYCYKNSGTSL